jgi:hypothetical protein
MEEHHDTKEEKLEEERKQKQDKASPTFRFAHMTYRNTQVDYPAGCTRCRNPTKYANIYVLFPCRHAICCDCYNRHEDYSAEQCEIVRPGYLSCPLSSCKKTIKSVTGYMKDPAAQVLYK